MADGGYGEIHELGWADASGSRAMIDFGGVKKPDV